MKAREILNKIVLKSYYPVYEKQTMFQKDCIELVKESGATQKQAERVVSKVWVEKNYGSSNVINLYDVLQEVEKMAYIFKA